MSRLSLLVQLLASSVALAAAPVGYAQATGYLKKASRPTLYQPLNLLDGREITSWCSPTADPLAEYLTFGFKGPVQVDEIRVYTGNGFDEGSFHQYARAKKFLIKGPTGETSFTVADQRGLQAVSLNPPLSGARFVMEILDTYPPEDPESPVCVTDVVFYSNGKPLNGSWLTQKLKYDRARAPVLGTWFAGYPGAADHFLSFFFDKTYRFSYQPFDPEEQGKSFGGKYEVNGNRVTLEVPGKGRVSGVLKHSKSVQEGQTTRALSLKGSNLPPELSGDYRDHP
jgi:hypothetical protein